jgi:hypothetical protein
VGSIPRTGAKEINASWARRRLEPGWGREAWGSTPLISATEAELGRAQARLESDARRKAWSSSGPASATENESAVEPSPPRKRCVPQGMAFDSSVLRHRTSAPKSSESARILARIPVSEPKHSRGLDLEDNLAAERARFAKPMGPQGLRFDSSVFRQSGCGSVVDHSAWDRDHAGSIPVIPTIVFASTRRTPDGCVAGARL